MISELNMLLLFVNPTENTFNRIYFLILVPKDNKKHSVRESGKGQPTLGIDQGEGKQKLDTTVTGSTGITIKGLKCNNKAPLPATLNYGRPLRIHIQRNIKPLVHEPHSSNHLQVSQECAAKSKEIDV